MEDRILSIEELAERYAVPVSTVWKWNAEGSGPPYFPVGKYKRYRLADVVAWEKARVVKSRTA